MTIQPKNKNRKGVVRIIGGQWRHRLLKIPDEHEVKPTPDRVRETLFNWLMPFIHDACCLDLFAGSGALGFEALSRGAAWVTFVDRSKRVANYLEKQIQHFNAEDKATIYHGCYSQLQLEKSFSLFPKNALINIVFLDPPFHKGILEKSIQWLEYYQHCLSPNSLLYLEYEVNSTISKNMGATWNLLKQKQAGQVKYELWQRNK